MFAASFVIGLSGAMMPGPVLSMTISETILHEKRRGWLVGVVVPAGHAILEIGLMIALWLGASALLVLPAVLRVIGIVGGLSLVLFGAIGLRTTVTRRAELARAGQDIPPPESPGDDVGTTGTRSPSLRRPFVMGFVLSATSSAWWAWWASIGMNAIAISSVFVFSSFAVFITFFAGHVASDFAWYGLVGWLVSASKKVMSPRLHVGLLVGTNIFLLVIGAVFIIVAIG